MDLDPDHDELVAISSQGPQDPQTLLGMGQSLEAGNNGCAARIFIALPVSTVISAHRVRSFPGSPQATDACGAKLALACCQQPGCRAG